MKIEIFDANNILRREFESFGSISRERMFVSKCEAHHVYVWDGYNHNARRRELFPGYKIRPKVGEDVLAWLDLMRELIMQTSATQIEVPYWEADDVIGVLARRWLAEGHEVHIHSNDLDYFQIEGAHLPGIKNPTGVERKYIPLYKTMVGDQSDRIPGVSGLGSGTFMKLEPHWDAMIEMIQNNGWYLDGLPMPKKSAAWIAENQDTLYAFWKIVHLWDVPLDLIEKHTYPGLNNPAQAEAILGKYML